MPEPGQPPRTPWRHLGLILGTAFTFPAAVLLGYLAGWWLDGKLGTKPWLSLLFMGFGFAAALLELLRTLKRLDRE